MSNIVRILRRLSVLGPAEIVHRFIEFVRMKWLELCIRTGITDRQYAALRFSDFQFCTGKKNQLPRLEFDDFLVPSAVEDLLAGRSQALGFDWQWRPEPGCWSLAPDTGEVWPSGVFFDRIDYRAGNPYGDVRVAWEPARLQQLVSLALIAKSSPDQRSEAVDLMSRILVSWVAANPLGRGIHYISVMECALRIIAVTHAFDIVRPYIEKQSAVWAAVTVLVKSQADITVERLSLYSSAGNHTTAECVGLVYAAVLFPEMKGAQLWFEKGMRVLEREAGRQVLSDGGGVERSPWYHVQVLDLFGLLDSLLRFHGVLVPNTVTEALHRGRKFLDKLGGSYCDLPRLNDADDGVVLSPHLLLSWLRESACRRVETFLETGFTKALLGDGADAYLLLDHGPLGMPPLHAHAHADALSLYIFLEGRPFATDPGTFMYTGGIEWRRYFRSTAAHNTIRVDGTDQAVQATPFQWSKPYCVELLNSSLGEDGVVRLVARHDGYRQRGVTHWRAVQIIPDAAIIICDFLAGNGHHELDMHWHFPAQPVVAAESLRFEGFSRSIEMSVSGGEIILYCGEENPIIGWNSSIYGKKDALTTVQVHHAGELPHEYVTLFTLGYAAASSLDCGLELERLREWCQEYRDLHEDLD